MGGGGALKGRVDVSVHEHIRSPKCTLYNQLFCLYEVVTDHTEQSPRYHK